MTNLIKTALSALTFMAASSSAYAQTSNCEIVLIEPSAAAKDAQFARAGAFMNSVYDEDAGHLSSVAGTPVRAVMCTRRTLLPSLRDLPILKTGLPLAISEDFDSASSGLLTVYDTGKEFKAEYSGPKLSPESEKKLRDTLEIFNLQKFAQ